MKGKQTVTPEYSSYVLRISRGLSDGGTQFQLQDVIDKSVHRFTDPLDLIRFVMRSGSQKSD